MRTYNTDSVVKFGHNPQTRSRQTALNAVGVTDSSTLRTLGFTPSNSNSIFVAKWGNDTTGTGTMENPVLTIEQAITLCDASHQKVGIMDSGKYVEKAFTFAGNFLLLFAMLGCIPEVNVEKNDENISAPVNENETVLQSSSTSFLGIARLTSGKIIYTFRTSSANGSYKVYNKDKTVFKDTTVFSSNDIFGSTCIELPGGNIIIAYSDWTDTSIGKYIILNQSFEVIKTATVFDSSRTENIACSVMQDGKIIIAWADALNSYKGYYLILNTDYTVYKSKTYWGSGVGAASGGYQYNTGGLSICTLSNGNILFVWADTGDSRKGKYVIMDTSFNFTSPATWNNNWLQGIAITPLYGDYIGISFSDHSDSGKGKFIIVDYSFIEIISETIFDSGEVYYTVITQDIDGFLWLGWQDKSSSYYGKKAVYDLTTYHLAISDASEINGIKFTTANAANAYYLSKFINASADLALKWCTFDGLVSETENQNCWAVYSDSEVNVNNCIFKDGDRGIYTEENASLINDSQFYRNTRGYAIHIKGTASSAGDIAIEHCDIFNNYAGIRGEDWGGTNEVVKNCIIHNNVNYGIEEDGGITLINSILTGSYEGPTLGTKVIQANPNYINEGAIDPDDTDLHIKTRLMGYPITSPAYQLADDSRNAGAYDVSYLLQESTREYFQVQKPKININYKAVQPVQVDRLDGTVSFYRDGITEYWNLSWAALTAAELDYILELIGSGKNSVWLYPEPVKAPYDYIAFTLVWNSITGSPEWWMQSDIGPQGVALVLAKKFEAGS